MVQLMLDIVMMAMDAVTAVMAVFAVAPVDKYELVWVVRHGLAAERDTVAAVVDVVRPDRLLAIPMHLECQKFL